MCMFVACITFFGLYDRLRNDPEFIKSGFSEAGISEAVESVIEPEDPYADLEFS